MGAAAFINLLEGVRSQAECFVPLLHNAGDGTVQLQSLTLGRGDAATPLALPALGYLLPGTRWQLSLPAGLAAAPLAPQARDAEGPVPLLAADD